MTTGDVCRAGVSGGNSWFLKNDVYKYTWLRMAVGRLVDKAVVDYLWLIRRMLGRLLDVTVWKGEGE